MIRRPKWWQPFLKQPFRNRNKDLCRLDPWPCKLPECGNQECVAYHERMKRKGVRITL